jgi:ribonuclease HII
MTQWCCGLDEAGRGPLAGPVYAACVILDPKRPIRGLADSKQLGESERDRLAQLIRERALAWCVASASVQEIDEINVLQATLLAMRRALAGLGILPAKALVDGNQDPRLGIPTRTIIKGDQSEPVISAASILAKTARDAFMIEIHAQLPQYGFNRHKGYPTLAHMSALRLHGVCMHHRRSFEPVRSLIEGQR